MRAMAWGGSLVAVRFDPDKGGMSTQLQAAHARVKPNGFCANRDHNCQWISINLYC